MISPPAEPRAIIVTRKTALRQMALRHGTAEQARFFVRSRAGAKARDFESIDESDRRFARALELVTAALPPEMRRVRLDRQELDRFLFAPDDLVFVVGQDGLVANVAKYLHGHLAFGINPDPGLYDGVLCRHRPEDAEALVRWIKRPDHQFVIQSRAMALARRDDGEQLRGLNEIYIGHRSHQSARYRLHIAAASERQSSSGIICSTGTGCTGWARSISLQRRLDSPLPRPEDAGLAWFVREPFPSVATQTDLNFGLLSADQKIEVVSEMPEDGVVFADGMEADFIEFISGHRIAVTLDSDPLRLVVPAESAFVKPQQTKPTFTQTHRPAPARPAARASVRLPRNASPPPR